MASDLKRVFSLPIRTVLFPPQEWVKDLKVNGLRRIWLGLTAGSDPSSWSKPWDLPSRVDHDLLLSPGILFAEEDCSVPAAIPSLQYSAGVTFP